MKATSYLQSDTSLVINIELIHIYVEDENVICLKQRLLLYFLQNGYYQNMTHKIFFYFCILTCWNLYMNKISKFYKITYHILRSL